jgi:hypothetical protein|tara:strand:- start:259 stop:603 length:345 start_codon:yes stop_codon:yes gene_type:complete
MSRIQREKLRLIQESNRRLLKEQVEEVPVDADGNIIDPLDPPQDEMTNPIYPGSHNALEAIQELLEVVGSMNKDEIVADLTGIVSRFTEYDRWRENKGYNSSAPRHGKNLYKGK